jgi:hypothetical protein
VAAALREGAAVTTNSNDVDLAKIPGYEPDKPPRRLDEATWYDELEAMWGRKWGACSTIGKLRTAMVTRPTDAYIETVVGHFGSDARALNLGSNAHRPDAEKLKHDHYIYVELLRANGVEVLYADLPEPMFGIYTRIRSHIAPEPTVIRGGAIMPRTAIAVKRGMEPIGRKSSPTSISRSWRRSTAPGSMRAASTGSTRITPASATACLPTGKASSRWSMSCA